MRKLFYDKTTGTVEPIRHLAGTAERSDAYAKIPGAAAQAAHHRHGASANLHEIRVFSREKEENKVRSEYIAKRVKNLVEIGRKT